jgi:hypothetical protein
MRDAVKLLLTGRSWPDSAAYLQVHHQQGRTLRSAVSLLVVSSWGQFGVNAHIVLELQGLQCP